MSSVEKKVRRTRRPDSLGNIPVIEQEVYGGDMPAFDLSAYYDPSFPQQ